MLDIFTEALLKSHTREGILDSVQESKQDFLEKGKKAQIGEIREWKGQKFQKQPNGGWIPVKQGQGNTKGSDFDWKKVKKEDIEGLPDGTKISYEDELSGETVHIEKKGNSWIDKDTKEAYSIEEVIEGVKHPDAHGHKIEKPSAEEENRKEEPENKAIAGVKDWIGDEASDQEISDVLDAVEDFVPASMLKIQASSPVQFGEKVYDRADEIMEKYQEHFDHWDGTDSMPDKQLRKILVAIMYDKRNPRA